MITPEVVRYAAAVRAALADLGAETRAHLLDDLEGHLAEVAAESDVPLVERLGPPDSYAAELLAAHRAHAGARPPSRRPRRRWLLVPLALLVAAGLGTWFVIGRDTGSQPWSSAQLTAKAADGQVGHVDIAGDSVVATDRAGRRHEVVDARGDERLAQAMTMANVDVTYSQPSSGIAFWLWVLLPNVGLLVIVAGLGALVVVAVGRRPRLA